LKVNNPDFSRLTSPIDIFLHECFERWYGVQRARRGGSPSFRGRWTPSAGTTLRETGQPIGKSSVLPRDYLVVPPGPPPTRCLCNRTSHQPDVFAGRGYRLRANVHGPWQVLSGRLPLPEYSTESTLLQQ
jgi:hypothetical protein